MVVLWSRHSVDSNWVAEEADDGKRRGILVPAFIDVVDPPIGFRSIQAADLSEWRPSGDPARFGQFLEDVEAVLRAAPAEGPTAEPAERADDVAPAAPSPERLVRPSEPAKPSRRALYVVGGLVLVIAIGPIGLWLGGSRDRTHPSTVKKKPPPQSTEVDLPAAGDSAPPAADEPDPPVADAPAADAERDLVYVSMLQNGGQGLSVVDPEAGRVIGTIAVPDLNTRDMSVNPIRREVYPSLVDGSSFYLIDARARPGVTGVEFSTDGTQLFVISASGVSESGDDWLRVCDANTREKLNSIALRTGGYPADVVALSTPSSEL